jgi:dTDP-4-dehydrorhamnose reductase
MKKAIITGASGTVGQALSHYLTCQQVQVISWDRKQIPINQYGEMEQFICSVQPNYLFHLAIASRPTGIFHESWKVNYEWSSELAWICRILEVTFIFASSVMVFSSKAIGPFTIDSHADASEGYGYEKRMAEKRVMYQNPQTKIARLGWQIADTPGSNNMVDYLYKQQIINGEIAASRNFYPSCSFLDDTAAALWQIANIPETGVFQVNSNFKWSFYEIAVALNHRHRHPWKIVSENGFQQDQRMLDDRIHMPPLEEKLTLNLGK